jgi:16S rRNA (guanine(966)-N(2))-methyltransferase RsmD
MEMRPTSDRMRETLFNIIAAELVGATFLDAYAGTGAVGIEALSRGARHAIFLEKHKAGVALIRENLASLGLSDRASVIAGPSLRELGRLNAEIVFLDPPYPLEKEYAPALELIAAKSPKLVVAQHSVRFDPGDRHGALERYRVLKQGDNALSFYRVSA